MYLIKNNLFINKFLKNKTKTKYTKKNKKKTFFPIDLFFHFHSTKEQKHQNISTYNFLT